jgi:hypothetical protein
MKKLISKIAMYLKVSYAFGNLNIKAPITNACYLIVRINHRDKMSDEILMRPSANTIVSTAIRGSE